jgi:hypothetical protein
MKARTIKNLNSLEGASEFIRKEIAKGVAPKNVREVAMARWPKLARKSEKPFLAARIKLAQKLAKHAHADN